MKKVFALTLVVIVFLSLFVIGVAEQEEQNNEVLELKIGLTSESIIKANEVGATSTVTGKIIDINTGELALVNNEIHLFYDLNRNGSLDENEQTPIASTLAGNGEFSLEINTNKAGNYFIFGVSSDSNVFNNELNRNRIRIIPKIVLNKSDALRFIYPCKKDSLYVFGSFINDDGEFTSDYKVTINYIQDNEKGQQIASASIVNNEYFSFSFLPDRITDIGAIGLFYDDILVAEGKITYHPNIELLPPLAEVYSQPNIELEGKINNYLESKSHMTISSIGSIQEIDANSEGIFSTNIDLVEGYNYIDILYGSIYSTYHARSKNIVYLNTFDIDYDVTYNQQNNKYSNSITLSFDHSLLNIESQAILGKMKRVDYEKLSSPVEVDDLTFELLDSRYTTTTEVEPGEEYFIKFFSEDGYQLGFGKFRVNPVVSLKSENWEETVTQPTTTISGYLAFAENMDSFNIIINGISTAVDYDSNYNFSQEIDLEEGLNEVLLELIYDTSESQIIEKTITYIDNSQKQVYAELSGQEIIEYSADKSASITGYILSKDTDAIVKSDCSVRIVLDKNNNGILDDDEMYENNIVKYTAEAAEGHFEITVNQAIGQYIVYGESNEIEIFDNSEADSYAVFKILPKIVLTEPSQLEFSYPTTKHIVIQGSFVNGDGQFDENDHVTLNYVSENNSMGLQITSAAYTSETDFGLSFEGKEFSQTGEIGLYYRGILVVKGCIKDTPNIFITNPSGYYDNSTIIVTGKVITEFTGSQRVKAILNDVESGSFSFDDAGNFTFEIELDSGINYLTVEYSDDNGVYNTTDEVICYYDVFNGFVEFSYDNENNQVDKAVEIYFTSNEFSDIEGDIDAQIYYVGDTSLEYLENVVFNYELIPSNINGQPGEIGIYTTEFAPDTVGEYYIKLLDAADQAVAHSIVSVNPEVLLISEYESTSADYLVEGGIAFHDEVESIKYSINGNDLALGPVLDDNGNFSFNIELQSYENDLKFQVVITNGQVYFFTHTVKLKTNPFEIIIDYPPFSPQQNNINISGHVENFDPNISVLKGILNGQETEVLLNDVGEFSWDLTLKNGYNAITLVYGGIEQVKAFFFPLCKTSTQTVKPTYDHEQNKYSGMVDLIVFEEDIAESLEQVTSKVYTIYDLNIHDYNNRPVFVSEIVYLRDGNKYISKDFKPESDLYYYVVHFNEENMEIGYSSFSIVKDIVFFNDSLSNTVYEQQQRINGYLAFHEDMKSFSTSVNGIYGTEKSCYVTIIGDTNITFKEGANTGHGVQELKEGVLMVPLESLISLDVNYGVTIEWDDVHKTATFEKGNYNLVATLDSNILEINGHSKRIPVAPFLKYDIVYIPIRVIAEELGLEISMADENGNFDFNIELSPGNNEVVSTLEMRDNWGSTVTRTIFYDYIINANPLEISTPGINIARQGEEYSFTFNANGGSEPYQWSVSSELPPGLEFNQGTLSGIPTQTGEYSLTIAVKDSNEALAIKSFPFYITKPIVKISYPEFMYQVENEISIEGRVANHLSEDSYAKLYINDIYTVNMLLTSNGNFEGRITLQDGMNVVKVTYLSEDNPLYSEDSIVYMYNDFHIYDVYEYDELNRQYKTAIELQFADKYVNTTSNTITAEVYFIEGGIEPAKSLEYVDIIEFKKIHSSYYHKEFVPNRIGYYYFRFLSNQSEAIGHSIAKITPTVEELSDLTSITPEYTFVGYVPLYEYMTKVEYSLNAGTISDDELYMEIDNIDEKGNFELELLLEPGYNHLHFRTYATNGQYSNHGYTIEYAEGGLKRVIVDSEEYGGVDGEEVTVTGHVENFNTDNLKLEVDFNDQEYEIDLDENGRFTLEVVLEIGYNHLLLRYNAIGTIGRGLSYSYKTVSYYPMIKYDDVNKKYSSRIDIVFDAEQLDITDNVVKSKIFTKDEYNNYVLIKEVEFNREYSEAWQREVYIYQEFIPEAGQWYYVKKYDNEGNEIALGRFYISPEIVLTKAPGFYDQPAEAVEVSGYLAFAENHQSFTTDLNGVSGLEQTNVLTVTGENKLTVKVGENTGYGFVELKEGVLTVPLRYFAENLNTNIFYDSESKTITFTRDHKEVLVAIDSKIMVANGEERILEIAPYVSEQVMTYVPFRVIAEALGLQISLADENGNFHFSIPVDPGVHKIIYTLVTEDGSNVKNETTFGYSPVIISPESLPVAKEGESYLVTFNAKGVIAPYQWLTGDLPAGLTFSEGTLAGVPTNAGVFLISISVMDNNKNIFSWVYELTVDKGSNPAITLVKEKSARPIFKLGDILNIVSIGQPNCNVEVIIGDLTVGLEESNSVPGYYSSKYTVLEGDNTSGNLTVCYKNAAGLESTLVGEKLIIDSVAPEATALNHNGELSRDYLFKQGEIVSISLTGDPGNRAWVEFTGYNLPEELITDTGGYLMELVETEEGVYQHSFTVIKGMNFKNIELVGYLVDEAGNQSTVKAEHNIGFDTIKPKVFIKASGKVGRNKIFTEEPTLKFMSPEAGNIIYYKINDSGSLTAYTDEFEVSDGEHIIYYYAEDRAGNRAPLEGFREYAVKVDTIDPQPAANLAIIAGEQEVTNGTTNAKKVNIFGDLPDDAWRVYLKLNNNIISYIEPVESSPAPLQLFSDIILEQNGENTIALNIIDEAGNESGFSTPITVFKDTTGPVFEFTTLPLEDSLVFNAITSKDISKKPNFLEAEVRINDEFETWQFERVTDNPVTYSSTQTIEENASIKIKLTAQDAIGNEATSVYSMKYFDPAESNRIDFGLGKFDVPEGALKGARANIRTNTRSVAPPERLDIIVSPTNFTATSEGSTVFEKPLLLMYYLGTPQDLINNNIDIDKIDIYYFNDQSGEWEARNGTYHSNPQDEYYGYITLSVEHFSTYSVLSDTVPPVLEINTPISGETVVANEAAISGITEPGATLEVNDTDYSSEISFDGSFTFTVPLLNEGTNQLLITASDSYGNEATTTINVENDSIGPEVSIEPVINYTMNATETFTITVTDNHETTTAVKVNGTEIAISSDNTIEIAVSLNEGINNLEIAAEDKAGNTSLLAMSVTRDNTEPTVLCDNHETTTNYSTIKVSGTVNEEVEWLKVNGNNALLQGNSYSMENVVLEEGLNIITISAKDLAGNIGVKEAFIEYDPTAPTLEISSIQKTTFINKSNLTLSGKAEANSKIEIYLNEVKQYAGQVTDLGEFSYILNITEEENTITVTVTDELDRSNTWTGKAYRDTEAPSLTITSPGDNVTVKSDSITVTGQVSDSNQSDENTLAVIADGQNANIVNGKFVAQISLKSGLNSIVITAKDSAGNTTSKTLRVTYEKPSSGGSSSGGGGGGFFGGEVAEAAYTIEDDELIIRIETEEVNDLTIETKSVTITDRQVTRAFAFALQYNKKANIKLSDIFDENEQAVQMTKLSLSSLQIQGLARTGISIVDDEDNRLTFESETLQSLKDNKQGLEIEFYSLAKEQVQDMMAENEKVLLAREINTGIKGNTTIRFRAPEISNLEMLMIRVVHDDGTVEEIKPELDITEAANFLVFNVQRFSTFIVYTTSELNQPEVIVPATEQEIILTLDKLKAMINGEEYLLDAAPYIKPGTVRTMVPVRFVSEGLGAEVIWNGEEQSVTIRDSKEIVLKIGDIDVLVDGVEQQIDSPPEKTTRTYVPIRFVSETLGAQVNFDSKTKQITIIR